MATQPKFTPGSWWADGTRVYAAAASEKEVRRMVADCDSLLVSRVGADLANARLIAAAPDLYAILREALPDLETGHIDKDHDCDCEACGLFARARAALAKAEGRDAR